MTNFEYKSGYYLFGIKEKDFFIIRILRKKDFNKNYIYFINNI